MKRLFSPLPFPALQFLTLLFVLLVTPFAYADGAPTNDLLNQLPKQSPSSSEPIDTTDPAPTPKPSQYALSVALAMDREVNGAFGRGPAGGLGALIRAEIMARENTIIGADGSYKARFGGSGMSLVNYGFFMKHYIANDVPAFEAASRIYILYGLKVLSTAFKDRVSSGLSHDTQFAFGGEFLPSSTGSFFSEISYHFSRLRYFEQTAQNLDHLEILFGYRFSGL